MPTATKTRSSPTPRKASVVTEAPPLRADASRNREAVLTAARKRFREHGADARIEDIARDAGVGVGTVCRRFPGKESMLEALIEQRFQGFSDRAHAALENPDPWSGFEDYIRYSTEVVAEDASLSEMIDARGDLVAPVATRLNLLEPLRELVKRAQAADKLRGDFSADDIPGLVCGLGRATRAGDFCSKALSWQRYLEIVIAGLRASR